MGLWSGADRLLGGYLPGGPSPGEVRYRETALGRTTGAVTAATLGTVGTIGATFEKALPGKSRTSYRDVWRNAYALGATGSRTPEQRGVTWGDAFRATAGALTPDILYKPPTNIRDPGPQHGSVPIADAVGKVLPLAAIAAGAIAVFALNR